MSHLGQGKEARYEVGEEVQVVALIQEGGREEEEAQEDAEGVTEEGLVMGHVVDTHTHVTVA